MIWLLAAATFVAAMCLDVAAARYYSAVADRARHRAAAWSVVMCLVSSVGLLAVTRESAWLLAPECAGLYAGTLIGVRPRADAQTR